MRRTKRKFFRVADLTSAIGDGPIGIKAGLHEQRSPPQPLFLGGGLVTQFLGKILGPSQEDTSQVVIKCRSMFKDRKRRKHLRKVSRP